MEEELDDFCNYLKYAATIIVAFGFFLKKIEDGGLRFLYANENKIPPDWSKLVRTNDDLTKVKAFLNKTDAIESCIRKDWIHT